MDGGARIREWAHDMRQPLATIRALVSVAEAQPVTPELRICIQGIKGQAEVLMELCQRSLGEPVAVRPVAVDVLVAGLARDAELAHRRTIDVAADRGATTMGDEVDLRRAVSNLLDNACRAADGSVVQVRVDVAGGEVSVSVADGGPGFGPEPARRASLGLGIVRKVAQEHGGRLALGTSELGGALVTLVLPAAAGQPGAVVDLDRLAAPEQPEKRDACPAS